VRVAGRHCTAGQYGYVPLGQNFVLKRTFVVSQSATEVVEQVNFNTDYDFSPVHSAVSRT